MSTLSVSKSADSQIRICTLPSTLTQQGTETSDKGTPSTMAAEDGDYLASVP
jgi:hypothetical protein